MTLDRRTFLKLLGGGAAASAVASVPLLRALAESGANGSKSDGEFFVFVHASGGWDVTLWADPRNTAVGIVDPATTENTDTGALRRWVDRKIDGDEASFEIVRPKGSAIGFGPGIGDLADRYDRLTVINGLSMNTVSHPDGTAYSATGRHLNGGRVVAASVDTAVANELGREQIFPVVSVVSPPRSSETGSIVASSPCASDPSTQSRAPSRAPSDGTRKMIARR
jgi:hypothetical protein